MHRVASIFHIKCLMSSKQLYSYSLLYKCWEQNGVTDVVISLSVILTGWGHIIANGKGPPGAGY